MIVILCAWLAAAVPVAALVPPLPVGAVNSALTSKFAPAALASAAAVLADSEMEIAELPPPYVPVLFGLALLVGVGVLTGSLGNVMDEEALRKSKALALAIYFLIYLTSLSTPFCA